MNFFPSLASTAGLRLLMLGTAVPTIAFLLSYLTCRLCPRASAAARHWIWMLAFVAMAVCVPITLANVQVALPILPPVSMPSVAGVSPQVLPATSPVKEESPAVLEMPVLSSLPAESGIAPLQQNASPVHREIPWSRLALGLWALGFFYLASAFVAGSYRLRGIVNRSWIAEDPRLAALWTILRLAAGRETSHRLLVSSEVQVPLVAGLWRPTVILPETATRWSAERLRTALIHELAHIERRDLWCSAFARWVAALYWFNPVTWAGLRRLHAEAEMAADDQVVNAESHPAAYAESLVMLVRDLRGNGGALFPVIGMLRNSAIEARVMRILDPNHQRRAPRRMVRWGALAGAMAISAGALMIRPVAAVPPSKEQSNPATPGPEPAYAATPSVAGAQESADTEQALLRAAEVGDTGKTRHVLDHSVTLGASDVKRLLDGLVQARKLTASATLLAAIDGTLRRKKWQPSQELLTSLVKDERKDFIDLLLTDGLKLEELESVIPGASESMQAWCKTRVGEARQQRERITGLVRAAGEGDVSTMRTLLEVGADVNGTAADDWTPLTKAAQKNQLAAVQLLLEKGAKVDQPRLPGWDYTALCLTNSVEIANALKKAGANVQAKLFGRDVSILTYVIRWAGTDLVQWFLDQGLDPKMIGDNDKTLLFEATNPKTLEVLLKRGVDPNRPDEFGNTPLMSAKDAESAKSLLAHGAKITGLQFPILPAMVNSASAEAIGVVLDAGAGQDGAMIQSALLECAGADKDGIALLLLKHGAKANEATAPFTNPSHKMLPLSVCCKTGAVKTARVLLENGADPNSGESPGALVREALANGHPEVANLLREAGAKGVSTLANAVGSSDAATTAALLETAPTYQKDPGFWSDVLPNAARLGDLKTVQAALAHGVPPRHGGAILLDRAARDDKEDAYEAAAAAGQDEVLQALLASRKDTDQPEDLLPALNSALKNSNPRPQQRPADAYERTVRLLLDAKAPVVVDGHNILILRAVFVRNGQANLKILEMLVAAGADPNPDGVTMPDGRRLRLLEVMKEATTGGQPFFRFSPECFSLLRKLAADSQGGKSSSAKD